MIEARTWDEFRATGLSTITNRFLEIFGWVLTFKLEEDGSISECFPSRCSLRGFDHEIEAEAYVKLSQWMNDHSGELLTESIEAFNESQAEKQG